ncbi:protein of unknown function [Vibrio tapetis subsp. tapetis]|uniref:Uncharacterized protein n=1 Tax=Vibrio tapetis subsp. tapetis TaxID=1671868 RepID=A0A2N8Z8E4_9VIBR|nr:protein of unknown function [Vibrio tapetis subsp. tapetis]
MRRIARSVTKGEKGKLMEVGLGVNYSFRRSKNKKARHKPSF